MSTDDQVIRTPEQVLRSKQIARINDLIKGGGHKPRLTSLRASEQEETDIM